MALAVLFGLHFSLQGQSDSVMVRVAADTLSADQQEGGFKVQALAAYNKGLAAYKQYQLDDALEHFTEALRHEPDFAKAYFNRGVVYLEGKKYGLATPDFDRYILLSDDPGEAYFLRARAHHLLGHRDRAYECYTECIGKGVKVDEAALFRAGFQYERGDYKAAVDDYTRCLAVQRDNAAAYHDRGSAYLMNQDVELAIADYLTAIKSDPGMARAYSNLGAAYRKQGKYAESLQELNQAVRLDPDNALVINSRGYAFFLLEDYEKAERDFRLAIDLDPKYALAYNNLSSSLIKQERYREAIDHASKAIKLQADYGHAYLNRGIAREMVRDMVGACADWQKADELSIPNAGTYRSVACKY